MEEFNTIYQEKSTIVDCSAKGSKDLKEFLASDGDVLNEVKITW